MDDGLYPEDNIIINKRVHLKAKTLYGAVIQGSGIAWHGIFIIRAPTEIEGFVLKDADYGILQRDSPDCSWTAHDLVILNIKNTAVSIDDRETNVGRGRLFNIMVHNASIAFNTNDAGGLEIENCFVSNCTSVFVGYNHLSFRADKIVVLRCKHLTRKSMDQPPPPGTNEVDLGLDLISLDRLIKYGDEGILSAYSGIFRNPADASSVRNDPFETLKTFAFNIFSDVYFKMKDYEQAIQWNQEALDISQKLNSPDTEWHAYLSLGRIYEEMGNDSLALTHYTNAIEVIDGIRSAAPFGLHKYGLMQGKMEAFEALIHHLFKLHEAFPSSGYDRTAFQTAEHAKARQFLDSLQEARIGIDIHLDPETQAKKARIHTSLAQIQTALKNPHLPPGRRQRLLEDLALQETLYESLLIRIKRNHPEFSDLLRPQPYTYEEIKTQLLDHETVLLECFYGKEHAFIFLATSTGLHSARLPAPGILAEYIRNYHLFLGVDVQERFKGIKGSRRLYDILLRPFEDKIPKGTKRMIIVPCGELYYLPFETLIRGEQASSDAQPPTQIQIQNLIKAHSPPNYLIRDYEISYAPSASSLINLKKRSQTPPAPQDMDLLAVANPRSRKPKLRFAVKEARRVSSYFDRKRTTLLLNKKAKESSLHSLDFSRYKVVLLVAHALIDDEKWWRSSLLLLPDKKIGEDGLLQPHEVYNLDLNADLVVLSACQTSQGRIEEGEGLWGFGRAFIYAGARSILASQWNIVDEAAPAFMGVLFRHLSEGRTVSQALRLAKINMITSTDYSHPFYWASFIVNGDAQARVNNR